MKKLLSFAKLLIAPFAIGIYTTATIVALSAYFYVTQGVEKHNPLLNLLERAHQISIDFRLNQRGPRAGSEQVALLTVDEKAVKTVGRWPWPREIIGQAIDRAVEMGAKVIAFDMVFSEPTDNAVARVYSRLKSKFVLPQELEESLQQEISLVDSDRIFSEVIEKHADKLVLGTFYNITATPTPKGYIERCRAFIFQQSPSYDLWAGQTHPLSVIDQNEVYIPEMLSETYKGYLSQLEEHTRGQFPPIENSHQRHQLQRRIEANKALFCDTWLQPDQDETYQVFSEAWSTVIENEGDDFSYSSFDEWVNHFKQGSLYHPMANSEDWVMNIPTLAEKAQHRGYFNADLDSDGTIRGKQLIARTGNSYMPAISFKAYLLAKNYNALIELGENPELPGTKKVHALRIIDNDSGDEVYQIPVDDYGRMTINYAGPRNMFPHLSLADVLSDDPEAEIIQRVQDPQTGHWESQILKVNKREFIKDKIFILGATAVGIFDMRVTPFDENYPGAETHANVVDNLLRRGFLKTHPDEAQYMMIGLLVFGLILSYALAKLGAVYGLLLTSALLAGTIMLDRYYLFGNGIVVSIIFPLLMILLLYSSLTFYKYFTEERGKKELRGTFQKYVSPAIVEEILKDPSNIELGGKKVNATVFFSDVRGFTTISEKLDPRALSDLLNSYLTPMTDLVFKNRGTLDKYMGDAIMAFFGAPIQFPDHAKHACRCALHSLEKLQELQEQYKKRGLPTIDIGIGLNTGDVSVGNMGSETVRSYTVMGDAVNLGSRLEGINKQYGTRIIISEFTYKDVKDDFVCREVDMVRVKGKILPVRIYELVAEGQAAEKTAEMLKWFNDGYRLYHEKSFNEALESFSKALDIEPSDPVSKLYIQRVHDYLETPPPEDWDGVFVMTTK